MISKLRQMGSATLVLITGMIILAACGPTPRNTAKDQIDSAVNRIKEENGENKVQQASSQTYLSLLEEGKDIQTSGLVFSPGSLPDDLAGISFYPRTRAAVLQFLPDNRVQIVQPSGATVEGKYNILSSSRLLLDYTYSGKEKQSEYSIQRSENYAMLHLQTIDDQDNPVPLLVVALLD